MKRLSVDVWSDVACPWCYVGKRRLEAALAEFPHASQVDVTWHAFELDPSAPATQPADVTLAKLLSKKYGMSPQEAERMMASTADVGKADGLDLRFDKVRSGNTSDAHRLIRLAKQHGKQGEMKERLFRAYFTEGAAVGEHGVLQKLGEELGLPAQEVTDMLASDQYVAEVRADEDDAAAAGIRGVPFYVFGHKYAVSGAQPKELFLSALAKAWNEAPAAEPVASAGDARCEPGASCPS